VERREGSGGVLASCGRRRSSALGGRAGRRQRARARARLGPLRLFKNSGGRPSRSACARAGSPENRPRPPLTRHRHHAPTPQPPRSHPIDLPSRSDPTDDGRRVRLVCDSLEADAPQADRSCCSPLPRSLRGPEQRPTGRTTSTRPVRFLSLPVPPQLGAALSAPDFSLLCSHQRLCPPRPRRSAPTASSRSSSTSSTTTARRSRYVASFSSALQSGGMGEWTLGYGII